MDLVTFGTLADDVAFIVLGGGGKIGLTLTKAEGFNPKSGILNQSRPWRLLRGDLDKVQQPMKFAGLGNSSDAIRR